MISLNAKIRKEIGKKTKLLRKKGVLPAVLYGPKIKPQSIEVDLKEFRKIHKQAGESSLISVCLGKEKIPVLIHEAKKDPLSGEFMHVDFYQPILTKEVEATVPLVFQGISLAIKDSAGTLIKEIQELRVKALPQNLPHTINVQINKLKTFDDEILVKDIELPEGVIALREQNEIVAIVMPPGKIEEELAKPVEEKVEDVEKVEKKEKPEEEITPEQTKEVKPEPAKKEK